MFLLLLFISSFLDFSLAFWSSALSKNSSIVSLISDIFLSKSAFSAFKSSIFKALPWYSGCLSTKFSKDALLAIHRNNKTSKSFFSCSANFRVFGFLNFLTNKVDPGFLSISFTFVSSENLTLFWLLDFSKDRVFSKIDFAIFKS